MRIFRFSVIGVIIVLMSYFQALGQIRNVPNKSVIQKVVISIPTLYCSYCEENIYNALQREESIVSFKIKLSKREVEISYLPYRTNPNNLRAIINNAGYQADTLLPNQDLVNLLPVCCRKEIDKDTVKYIQRVYRRLRIKLPKRKDIICCYECDLYYLEIIKGNRKILNYFETPEPTKRKK